MADNSRIEWTDVTWNPVTGCTRASRGCDNCYAVVMTKRLEAMGQAKYAGLVTIGKTHFNGVVRTHEDALMLPFSWKKPKRVFVNSMSDLFHKDVPFEFIDKVFAIMAITPQHTYQVLTKRPERMAEYLAGKSRRGIGPGVFCDVAWEMGQHCSDIHEVSDADYTRLSPLLGEVDSGRRWPLPNVWLGTSCEDQQTANERIPHLLKCPAAVRFLSCEPLLGPLRIDQIPEPGEGTFSTHYPLQGDHPVAPGESWRSKIHWVIVGGESGSKARPMHPWWPRSLRDQCREADGVKFFFKQWGEFHPRMRNGAYPDGKGNCDHLPGIHIFEDGTLCGQVPNGRTEAPVNMKRIGKKKAGRLLDGVEWSQFPEEAK